MTLFLSCHLLLCSSVPILLVLVKLFMVLAHFASASEQP